MTTSRTAGAEETMHFEGLTIRFDDRVLRPRPWTSAQSRWGSALLGDLPPGPVLELCAGAGQIGLAAVARTSRRLVMVEADPVAVQFAIGNARTAGMAHRVEVRQAPMTSALVTDEEFPLVIADPPWVRRDHTERYPEDPVSAIDGGPDGLELARECLEVIGDHLAAAGVALLQLGSAAQCEALVPEIDSAGLELVEIRRHAGGVVVRLDRSAARPWP